LLARSQVVALSLCRVLVGQRAGYVVVGVWVFHRAGPSI